MHMRGISQISLKVGCASKPLGLLGGFWLLGHTKSTDLLPSGTFFFLLLFFFFSSSRSTTPYGCLTHSLFARVGEFL